MTQHMSLETPKVSLSCLYLSGPLACFSDENQETELLQWTIKKHHLTVKCPYQTFAFAQHLETRTCGA